jgi:hypothetical protein
MQPGRLPNHPNSGTETVWFSDPDSRLGNPKMVWQVVFCEANRGSPGSGRHRDGTDRMWEYGSKIKAASVGGSYYVLR